MHQVEPHWMLLFFAVVKSFEYKIEYKNSNHCAPGVVCYAWVMGTLLNHKHLSFVMLYFCVTTDNFHPAGFIVFS